MPRDPHMEGYPTNQPTSFKVVLNTCGNLHCPRLHVWKEEGLDTLNNVLLILIYFNNQYTPPIELKILFKGVVLLIKSLLLSCFAHQNPTWVRLIPSPVSSPSGTAAGAPEPWRAAPRSPRPELPGRR